MLLERSSTPNGRVLRRKGEAPFFKDCHSVLVSYSQINVSQQFEK